MRITWLMARSSIQRLISKKEGTVECQSCGAVYVIHEKNCPWCGAANDLGQEENYIRDPGVRKLLL